MPGRAPSKRNFLEVLEQGAKVDEIFKDSPVPRGSNPFEEGGPSSAGENTNTILLRPIQIEEPTSILPKLEEPNLGLASIVDNDSLFCINRKFAAIEALFRLVGRDSYSFGQLISEILRVAMDQVKSEAGSFL